ncbi:cysteinyl-trna synthetase [Stylonychia lemnae]|uniref:cysteine--tRNA ligase n=1 Tax=Stylonychia lemnae TaxID=5949 RepID=A0A078AQK8_STYLE|nr:cysteinyl-trna synthetase [Stylonychia lemnae]|eukprot:CDW84464.1 cysteinyl-trna synthetase [Stylonychia lemnae]
METHTHTHNATNANQAQNSSRINQFLYDIDAPARLHVLNSFSKTKELFVPNHSDQNVVTWYMCGPTVYDDSHIGHARTYVSSDIIKRILRDYFGYDVKMCMNITDIDDKIIRKAIESGQRFDEISRKYETDFLQDMKDLNVELPDVITRVSEFVPEIITFTEKIIANGFAYESNGSVYFDVAKFNDGEKHKYAKLEPTSATDTEKLKEGEGVLTDAETTEKKNQFDFALWKKSKPGEPVWDSPWGQGRPGWHIECSAMAAEFFKEFPIDIHSGGIDLRFPHHDNEIAQSEAYYDCDNWINYFIHTGHLHIEGKKMSKSLKNFITIRYILDQYSARQIRFLFLLHNWDSLMNYSTLKSMPEAIEKERKFSEFFKNLKAIMRQCDIQTTEQKWNAKDYELDTLLTQKQVLVHERLADSFDTPAAVNHLSDIISATNTYLQQDKKLIKLPLLRKVSKYVLRILKVFGVYDDDVFPAQVEGQTQNKEKMIAPYVNALSKFRDLIKENADKGPKDLMVLCDQLRDDVLPHLGIRLEDRAKGVEAIWKYEDKDVLLKEKEAKIKEKEKKEEEKKQRKELELRKKSTPGSEWFKVFFADKYSQFDAEGLPTHGPLKQKAPGADGPEQVQGELLSESIRNKLKKEQNKQDQVYQKYLKELESQGPSKQEHEEEKAQ